MLGYSIPRIKAFQLKAKTSIVFKQNSITWITYNDTLIRQKLSFSSLSLISRSSKLKTNIISNVKVDIPRVKFDFIKHEIKFFQYRGLINEAVVIDHNNNTEQIVNNMMRRSKKITPEIEELRRKHFPAWLEGLGLKHLARYFKGKKWEEIIEMDWQALEVLGIESRQIRAKLVGHFWKVKRDIAAKKGITLPEKEKKGRRELIVEEKKIIAQREKFYEDNYININYKLLEDFPAWLDGLDLKYLTLLFEEKPWNEIINLDSQNLMDIGVNYFTPRDKLLTCFWFIKRDLAIKHGTELPSIELVKHRRFLKIDSMLDQSHQK
ncbi:11309_t:CDS:2 [Scutellospora calospora]|uniref:11309_t:CDS:1 n=1 Tax=Scutellospora calospora TaxID=85575 RepID=A0ACA9JTQ0_9GLOM|nr:11309_t:CDS:2 [Scutellospora calospora]